MKPHHFSFIGFRKKAAFGNIILLVLSIMILIPVHHTQAQEYISLKDCTKISSIEKEPYTRDITVHDDGVTVSYNLGYAQLIDDPIFPDCKIVQMQGFGKNSSEGEPWFPQRVDFVTLPHGTKAYLEVIETNYADLPIKISPARPLLRESSYEEYTQAIVPQISPYKGVYPTRTVTALSNQEYRGSTIARYCIRPVQYDYEKNITRIYSKIVYRITFYKETTNEKYLLKAAEQSLLQSSMLKRSVTPRSSFHNGCAFEKDYLIITVPEFYEAANRFAEWKRLMGYNVILSSRNSWTSTDITNEIISQYNSNDNLYYLLFIGSHSRVPGKQIQEPPYPIRYSDYYYGCTGGPTDSIPDIYVGRLPVTTAYEANTIVDKIIGYEKNPVADSGLNHLQYLENCNRLPVVFSMNCHSGQYYNTSIRCFADSILTMRDGGAVAVYASIFETSTGPNDILSEAMFESVWPLPGLLQYFGTTVYYGPVFDEPTYELGKILQQGLEKVDEVYMGLDPRDCLETHEVFNIFGDPSMEIRTEVPQPFQNVTISRSFFNITVDLGNDVGRITFYDKYENCVYSIVDNYASFYGLEDSTYVCVYGHNRIPIVDAPQVNQSPSANPDHSGSITKLIDVGAGNLFYKRVKANGFTQMKRRKDYDD